MLGEGNSQRTDSGWLIHVDQHRTFRDEVLVDRDQFVFVVGQGLVQDFGAVFGDGTGPVVFFPRRV
ncbi:hypothetical protein AS038_11470 [Arthrobacter sp. NIO-1057]|nr:hypothetical protein AS038_11470 [Arthrobacter sp. NIO-1057]